MPEISLIDLGLLVLMLIVGFVVGWMIRSDRCAREKKAVSASWQQQLDSRQSEHDRLIEQNKSLMQQISQYQVSHKDSAMRAKELSESLKQAFAQRDEIKGEIDEAQSALQASTSRCDELQAKVANLENEGGRTAEAVKKKDDKISRLSRELENWQNRVPPLVERFRERDEQAKRFELELSDAREMIAELRASLESDQTRIEPADPDVLPGGLDASNEPHAQTLAGDDIEEFREFASVPGGDGDDPEVDDATVDDDPVDAIPDGMAPDGQRRDDLQQIKGVGPFIEKTLNDLGIYRFHQISEMSEYDIDRIAQKLRGFRTRIYREDWIGQARILRSRQFDHLT